MKLRAKFFLTILILGFITTASVLSGSPLDFEPGLVAGTLPQNPVYYLNDGDLSTSTTFAVSAGIKRIPLQLESASLIHGMEIAADLPAGTVVYLEYEKDGLLYPFPGSLTDWRYYQTTIDVSSDLIVTDKVYLTIESANFEDCYIAEVTVLGESKSGYHGRIDVKSVETSHSTSIFASEKFLTDGLPGTFWEKEKGEHFTVDHHNAVHLLEHVYGRVRRWHRNRDIEIEFGLEEDSVLESVNLYFSDDAQGRYIVEIKDSGRWREIGRVQAHQTSGWTRLDFDEPTAVSQARIRVQDRRGHSRGLGEVEFIGRGGYRGNQYKEIGIWNGWTALPFSDFVFEMSTEELYDRYSLELFADSSITELDLNGYPLEPVLKESRENLLVYTAEIRIGDLQETNVLSAETDGDILYSRLCKTANSGRIALDESGLGDGDLVTDGGLNGTRIVELDGRWIVDELHVYGEAPAMIRIYDKDNGTWETFSSEYDVNGNTVFKGPDSVFATRLELTGLREDTSEIQMLGRSLGDSEPYLRIVYPFNRSQVFKFNTRQQYVIGITDSPESDITLNGQDVWKKGNLFWTSFRDLGIDKSLFEEITVTARLNDFVHAPLEDTVVFNAMDTHYYIYLFNDDNVIFSSGDSYRISGLVYDHGTTLKIDGETVRTGRCGFFSYVTDLEDGSNVIEIELFDRRDRLVNKRQIVVVKDQDTAFLSVVSPADGTLTSERTINLEGMAFSMAEAEVLVNGVRAEMTGYRFSAKDVALVEGENILTIELVVGGEVAAAETVTVTVDSIPPVISSFLPEDGQWVRTNPVPVTGTVDESNSVVVMINGTAASFNGSNFTAFVPAVEGTNVMTAYAVDGAGNRSEDLVWTTRVDTTRPEAFEIGGNVNVWTNDNTPEIVFETIDTGIGIDHYEIIIDSGAPFQAASPYELPVLSDGVHNVSVLAYDGLGWVTPSDTQVKIDTIAPPAVVNQRAVPGDGIMSLRWSDTDETADAEYFTITRQPAFDHDPVVVQRETGDLFTDENGEIMPEVGYQLEFSWTDENVENGYDYVYSITSVDKAVNLSAESQTPVVYGGIAIVEKVPGQGLVAEYDNITLFMGDEGFPEEVVKVVVTEVYSEELEELASYPIVGEILDMAVMVDDDGEIVRRDHYEFGQEFLGVIHYDEELIGDDNFMEENLGVYYFDQFWSRWVLVPKSLVDKDNNVIYFRTDHFSLFSVQPTYVQDLSPQEMADVEFTLSGGIANHDPVSVSPQGGSASTAMTEFVLPGMNGFDLEIRRVYDSSTARADAQSWSLNISIGSEDIKKLISGGAFLDIAQSLAMNLGTNIASQAEASAKKILQNSGDYAYSMGTGWRLNFPYIRGANSGLILRHPDGGYIDLYSLDIDEIIPVGVYRHVKFVSQEQDFVFIAEQGRGDVNITSTVSSAIGSISNETWPKPKIPGWVFMGGRLILKDGTTYHFDSNGRCTKITDPTDQHKITFHYDGLLLDHIVDSMGRTVNFEYGGTGINPTPLSPMTPISYSPKISRIWIEDDTAGQNGDPREVRYYHDVVDVNGVSMPVPLLKTAIDFSGREYQYNYEKHTLDSGELGIKMNILAMIFDIAALCGAPTGAVSSLLGIESIRIWGMIQSEYMHVMNSASGTGIGYSRIDWDEQNFVYFNFQFCDFILGNPDLPSGVSISMNSGERVIADELKLYLNPGGMLLKRQTFDYDFEYVGHRQFVNEKSVVREWGYSGEGDFKFLNAKVYNYDSFTTKRLRWLDWSDYASDIINSGAFTEDPFIYSHIPYNERIRTFDNQYLTGDPVETQSFTYYKPQLKLKSDTVVRADGSNFRRTEYEYDTWGNAVRVLTTSRTGSHSTESETRSYYAHSNIGPYEGFPWEDNPFSTGIVVGPDDRDPLPTGGYRNLAHEDIRTMLLGSMTRYSDPLTGDDRYTRSYNQYDGRGRLINSATGVGDEWAIVNRTYYPETGELKTQTSAEGQMTEFVYDYDAETDDGTPIYTQRQIQKDVLYYEGGDIITETGFNYIDGFKLFEIDGNGYVTSYRYDAVGRPTRIEKPAEEGEAAPVTTVEYDDENLTVSVVRPLGAEEVYTFNNIYQLNEIRKEIRDRDEKGNLTGGGHDSVTKLDYDAWGNIVSVTDPNGNETEYRYDFTGRLEGVLNPDGSSREMTFDFKTNTETVRDEEYNYSTNVKDMNGNVISTSQTVWGETYTTESFYDGLGQLVREVDRRGNATDHYFDERGKEIRTVLPQAEIFDPLTESWSTVRTETESFYNLDGVLVSQRTPLSRTDTLNDGLGRPVTITSYENPDDLSVFYETQMRYDGNSNTVLTVDPLGGEVATEFTARNQQKLVNDKGAVTTYEYDLEDNAVSITGPRGNSGEYPGLDFTIDIYYDDLERLIGAELPVNGELDEKPLIRFVYDDRGNLLRREDPDGSVTVNTYSNRHFLMTEERLDPVENKRYTSRFAYDYLGNRIRSWDPADNMTIYTYDEAGQMRSQTSPMGTTVTFVYDGNGNVTEQTDGRSGVEPVKMSYDALNRVLTTTLPEGGVYLYGFDANGNAAYFRDANGKEIVTEYDGLNRMIRETRSGLYVTEKTYDAAGNVHTATDPNGTVTTYTYDERYNPVHVSAVNGGRVDLVSYTYDIGGMLKSSANNGVSTRFNIVDGEYRPDPYGLVWRVEQTFGGESLEYGYEYDEMQRITAVVYSDGSRVDYEYNLLGELVNVPGYVAENTIRYDNRGVLEGFEAINGLNSSFNVNADGNLTRLIHSHPSDARPVVDDLMFYDLAGNMIQKNTNEYAYDGNSRLISAALFDGFDVSEEEKELPAAYAENDPLGEKALAVQPEEALIKLDYWSASVGYDFGGALSDQVRITRVELFPGDPDHRIDERDIAVYTALGNVEGNFVEIEDWELIRRDDGVLDIRFEMPFYANVIKIHCHYNDVTEDLDPLDYGTTFVNSSGALMKIHYLEPELTEGYTYQPNGNRETVTINNEESAYEYHENTDWISFDGTFHYQYDNNGNMTAKYVLNEDTGEITERWDYAYNLFNQLESVRKDGETVAIYRYDHNGLLVQRIGADGEATRYLHSLNGKLLEAHGDKRSRRFIYVFNRNFAEKRIDRTLDGSTIIGEEERTLFYITDHLGSTVAMADEEGNIVWGDNFTPFGSSTGEWGYELEESGLFTGKFMDEATGLYYYNARWYDPELGRFVTEDPIRDGQNWFVYASNNPLKFVDPTGLEININSTFDEETGNTYVHIDVTAKLLNESNRDYTSEEMETMAELMKDQIEESFSGNDGDLIWDTTISIDVIESEDELSETDHIFRIVNHDELQRKQSIFERINRDGDIIGYAGYGENFMYVSNDKSPYKEFTIGTEENKRWQIREERKDLFTYTAAHEFGHSLGLRHPEDNDDIHSNNPLLPGNLMYQATNDNYGTRIEKNQILEILNQFNSGELNNGSQGLRTRRF